MKTRYIFFLAIATLALSACVKNTEPSEPEGMQMTFKAYQEGSEMTRTTVQDGGTQVYWEPSDEIKVFFNGSSGRFVSQNTANATVATFTGTLNVIVGATEGAGYSTQTWGLYPYRADAVLDGDALVTTLPASQTGRAGSFAKNTNITVAQSNGYGLAFYNVCGGLRFSLTQEGIKRVTFQGNNEETIAGKIKVAFADGIPVVQEISEGEKMITLTAPNGESFQTGQWYYISAIPGSLSGGYKMVFYKESESAKLTSSSSVTFKRGIFGSLADADEDLMFKPTGGDEPNPDDVIQFKDPIAKFACVDKFDTNGDGEVSYEEAAAATSLSGLFTNWNTVTTFDEIKYFTGANSTEGVFDGCSKLESIIIPNFIITLGSFQNCTSLTSVVLPSGIQSIPKNCFLNCSSLLNLDLPASVSLINDNAFKGCIKLSGMILPAGLKTIGGEAFYGCTSLTSVSIGDGVSCGNGAFAECSSLTSVVLPSDMITIPSKMFYNCKSLNNVSWPSALESVGNSAFYGCFIKMDSDSFVVDLPASVKSLGNKAFYGVKHIVLPSSSAITIASDTFIVGCTRIYVPAGMIEIYKVRTNWSIYAYQLFPLNDYPAIISFPASDAIDLGLSVNWAEWNVGATAPEEYGCYYAWGDVDSCFEYNWSTYKWCNGSNNSLTKYNTNSSYGTVDNKTTLELEDDAAHVNWGGNWRMPTRLEIQELINNCTISRTTKNGINGWEFTSKLDGFTDKSIFFPAVGYSVGYVGVGARYWSSSLVNDVRAYFLMDSNSTMNLSYYDRCDGDAVRPVCPKD